MHAQGHGRRPHCLMAAWKSAWQALWSLTAVLFVLLYTALLLLIPMPSPKWRRRA